ncbi:hypothetical protein BKA69DRAFT_1123061 [Paraphysoderma sedebokerense]|nr:hypothetical protein BKA69DRAFT_1123061 [Paraphysoderma sedebokerense]
MSGRYELLTEEKPTQKALRRPAVVAVSLCLLAVVLFVLTSIFRGRSAWPMQTDQSKLCSYSSDCIASKTCCPDYLNLSNSAFHYLKQSRSIADDEELERDIGFGMVVRWMIVKMMPVPKKIIKPGIESVGGLIEPHENAQFVVVGKCVWNRRSSLVTCGEMEVVVLVRSNLTDLTLSQSKYAISNDIVDGSNEPELRFYPFESMLQLPSSIYLAISSITSPLSRGFYYIHITGPTTTTSSSTSPASISYLSSLKSLLTATPYCGFSAKLYPSTSVKAPYDPTPSRTWHLKSYEYSIRRGEVSPISFDIAPESLDFDYDYYARESNRTVIPWLSCYIRQVRDVQGHWVELWSDSGDLKDNVDLGAVFGV